MREHAEETHHKGYIAHFAIRCNEQFLKTTNLGKHLPHGADDPFHLGIAQPGTERTVRRPMVVACGVSRGCHPSAS